MNFVQLPLFTDPPLTKRCSRGAQCLHPLGAEQPATPEYFHRCKNKAMGLQSYCKACDFVDRAAKSEQRAASTRRWQSANKERCADNQRDWRMRHPEKTSEYNERFRLAHPEAARANLQRWTENNRDYVNAQARQRWRERYSEKYKPVRSRWRKNNKLKTNSHFHKHRALKLNAEGCYTDKDIARQYQFQNGNCYWCSNALLGRFDMDHVVPLSRGGSNAPDNLVCSCRSCNASKGAKLAYSEWIPINPLITTSQ